MEEENAKLISIQKKQEKTILLFLILVAIIIDLLVGFYYNWGKFLLLVIIISILIVVFIHTNRPRKCIICSVKMKRIITKNDYIIFKCEECNNIINTKVGTNGNPS